jgi:tRNA pseudouridine38-40 synthase
MLTRSLINRLKHHFILCTEPVYVAPPLVYFLRFTTMREKTTRGDAGPSSKHLVSRKNTTNTKQKVALLFGYVGTGYHGLQWTTEFPTIEKALEEAIYKNGNILDSNYGDIKRVKWVRSSRTDKGVHALANVVSLFMELPPSTFEEDPLGLKLSDQINRFLPSNIRVFSVAKVSRRFNPREQCMIRSYNVLWPRKYLNESAFSIEKMKELMKEYEGFHNFHNFTRAKGTYNVARKHANNEDGASAETAQQEEDEESDGVGDDAEGDGDANENDPEGKNKQPRSTPKGIIPPRPPDSREEQLALFVKNSHHNRRILRTDILPPFKLDVEEDEEWVIFKFVGESFAYNQIRRMLGFVLLVAHGYVPVDALRIALRSPFKFMVPMTPGECLYLEGGTFFDRHHFPIDLFSFFPASSTSNESPPASSSIIAPSKVKFNLATTQSTPWAELLEASHILTSPGAAVLLRIKEFRDKVLHPHIADLFKTNNSYEQFVVGLGVDRFKINDLNVVQSMYAKWEPEEQEKRERKRKFRAEIGERKSKGQLQEELLTSPKRPKDGVATSQ